MAESAWRSRVGTAFTYQGRLIDANNAADGLYDFQFKMFDDETVGNKLGTDVNVWEVDVIDGYFTIELDFGDVFDGNERWLDIGVRPGDLNDPNVYTVLTPRQQLTPAPYAISALTGGEGGESLWQVNGTSIYYNTGNVGIGTTSPSAKLDVSGEINASSNYKVSGNTILSAPGSWNTFIGFGTGYSDTTGWGNTFSGYQAGYLNTEGIWNTFSGYEAGYSNSIGNCNTFLGGGAGYSNTTGISNTFSGFKAGYSNTEGYGNTFSGREAGYSNTTGSGNVFLGNQAGYYETGSNKMYIANSYTNPPLIYGDFSTGRVGIGTTSPAAKLDVVGDINAASVYKIGGSTILSIAGTSNTFVGMGAGAVNTGSYNTFSGNSAGYSNTTGYSNTFSGFGAGRSNTTGSSNTFSGYKAGFSNTTGFGNTFSGYQAGSSNTTGYSNTFSGYGAGHSNTTGYYNTFSGYEAGFSNTSGYYNTFSGNYAGYSNTTGSGNTFSGYEAGFSNTSGGGNVFVGYGAGYSETSSNKLYIANSSTNPPLIYGDFSTGRIGLGTTGPATKLDVNGVITVTGGNSTNWNTAYGWGNHALAGYLKTETDPQVSSVVNNRVPRWNFNTLVDGTIYDNGNIGIGTESPTAKLEVAGQVKITDGSQGNGKVLTSDDYGYASWQTPAAGLPAGTSGQTLRHDGTNWVANSLIFNNGTSVGIGTSNPQGLLQVGEPIIVVANSYLSGVEESVGISDSIDPEYTPEAKLEISRGGTDRDLLMLSSYPSADGDVFIVKNSGNVGIGTTSPSNKLDVVGQASISGNVGIGTATPARNLHINDVMRLQPRDTAPSDAAEGDIYMDSTTHKLMVYTGTGWEACN